jgi:hypothetical protein
MTELHRLQLAIDDQGGTESRSQAQKQHLAALVAADSLHGSVIDDLYGTTEGCGQIEADPAMSQVGGFRTRPAFQDRAGVAVSHPADRPDCHRILGSQLKFFRFMADHKAFALAQRVLHLVQTDFHFQ